MSGVAHVLNQIIWGYGLGTIIGQLVNFVLERKWR
jgi:hypothetical protein